MNVLTFHPLADVLPLIEGAEFGRLVADIAEHGLLNPITVHDGKILDGRNRQRACHAAGVEPRYVEFDGKDPAAFVLSQNLARRHLGPSERAMVAARMANLRWGQRADRVEGSIDSLYRRQAGQRQRAIGKTCKGCARPGHSRIAGGRRPGPHSGARGRKSCAAWKQFKTYATVLPAEHREKGGDPQRHGA
jgi:hypothetical protein